MDSAFSPDGEHIALSGYTTAHDIYLVETASKEVRQLTNDAFRDRGASFTPDSQRVLWYTDRGGSYEIWSMGLDGSAATVRSQITGDSVWFPDVSPDGGTISVHNEHGTQLATTRKTFCSLAPLDKSREPRTTKLSSPPIGLPTDPVWREARCREGS